MGTFSYIEWLRSSLDNSKDGASGKKMAAFYIIMVLVTPLTAVYAFWAYMHDNWELMPEILGYLLIFAAAALGLNGAEKIIENLKRKKNENNPDTNAAAGAE